MKTYDWGDGHGKVHSRPKKNRGEPKAPKPTGREYINAPLTTQQIGAQADQMAGFQYGGQEQQIAQRQQAVAPWFQNYMTTIQGAQQQNQQLVQPMVDQARTAATNSGQTVLDKQGVDPTSEAAQNDVLAAAGRKALGDAAATQLASILGAGQTFLGNQQAIAPMYQQQVTQDLGNQQSALQKEKGAYRASTYGDLVGKERDYGLALRHQGVEDAAFNVDTANTAADNQREDQRLASQNAQDRRDRRVKRQAGRAKTKQDRANYIGKYGIAPENVSDGLTAAERKQMSDYKKSQSTSTKGSSGLTPAQKRAASKERGKAVQRVIDIKGEFNRLNGQRDEHGKGPTRDQVISELRKKYSPAEVTLGLKIRANEPLTKKDIATAKRLGIWPIPKGWTRARKPQPTGGSATQGASGYPYGEGAGSVH